MFRKLLITGCAFLSAIPAFANTTTKFDASQLANAQQPKPVALRLMSDSQFATFLERLDADLLRSELQLKKMDVKSLSLDAQEKQELQRSYLRCLQSLDGMAAAFTEDEVRDAQARLSPPLDAPGGG